MERESGCVDAAGKAWAAGWPEALVIFSSSSPSLPSPSPSPSLARLEQERPHRDTAPGCRGSPQRGQGRRVGRSPALDGQEDKREGDRPSLRPEEREGHRKGEEWDTTRAAGEPALPFRPGGAARRDEADKTKDPKKRGWMADRPAGALACSPREMPAASRLEPGLPPPPSSTAAGGPPPGGRRRRRRRAERRRAGRLRSGWARLSLRACRMRGTRGEWESLGPRRRVGK